MMMNPKQTIRLPCHYRQKSHRLTPIRFTPYAWAKLIFLRDLGSTEVGGFGISSWRDPLFVEDVFLVRQRCTAVTVKFNDESVADFFDYQVDEGRLPEEFARIWIHTHPGCSAEPSFTDEETFARAFGEADWSVMFILARGGRTYARLRFSAGPSGQLLLPAEVDFSRPFGPSTPASWKDEYHEMVETDDVTGAWRLKDESRLEPLLSERLKDFDSSIYTPPAHWPEDLYGRI